jgi:hypothetical protein
MHTIPVGRGRGGNIILTSFNEYTGQYLVWDFPVRFDGLSPVFFQVVLEGDIGFVGKSLRFGWRKVNEWAINSNRSLFTFDAD